jgi:hypothetical protein
MAITTLDQLVAAFPGQLLAFTKASVASVAGAFISLWAAAGQPGAGSLAIGNTTTGVIPTDATAGAFPFSNPGGGNLSYLARAVVAAATTGTLVWYDRLWHGGSYTPANGNISTTTTTAIDRDSTGAGAELWAEINTGLSAVALTLTVTYVNQAGTGGRTATCAIPASAIASRMFPFVLQAGDSGIRQITNIAGNAAPTGSFNLVILRRLAELPVAAAAVATSQDYAALGLPRVYDDACIAAFMNTNTTSSGALSGSLSLVQG